MLASELEASTIRKDRAAARDPTESLVLSDPQDAQSWISEAKERFQSSRYAEAGVACDRALALNGGNISALRLGILSRIFACDWSRWEADKREINECVNAGERIIAPLYHLGISDSGAKNLRVAELWSKLAPASPKPLWRGERYQNDKIRIAYLSSDFRNNVLAEVIAGCFEHHDKTRFDTTAISLGADDGSPLRRRIAAAFDRFIDVKSVGDREIARQLRELKIDIAIDLQGYTRETCLRVLAHRPAPVQVNYLGYPGTVGAPFVDYIIADRIVIPEEDKIHYSEEVVHLPGSYLPNDFKQLVIGKIPSRIDEGLPATGFVFACFNHAVKIRPEIFDIWMRLLCAVEGSVLWLRATNLSSMTNLKREAVRRGVDAGRIIFASRKPGPEHLARQRLADLFLDTLPYNAHTTANEALWVGLPILTCLGHTFPGRVAASLLEAVDLPELVTRSLKEYEAVAGEIANNPALLGSLRSKLMRNRYSSGLYDTARFTRGLEAAITTMWERSQRGEPPKSFSVTQPVGG